MQPALTLECVEELSLLEVDDFIEKVDNSDADDVVSFLIQCPYKELSEDTRNVIYRKVRENCDVIEGKYWLKHPNTGIVVCTAC